MLSSRLSRFVPKYRMPSEGEVREFVSRLNDVERISVLTGAGISTESGIPDYRSAEVGMYARSDHRPVNHQEFMSSLEVRRRYWARNFVAWPRFRDAMPNTTHYAISGWERSDRFGWLITQNVDSLHVKAGSTRLTELHGSGHWVKCMQCGDRTERESFQKRLNELNEDWFGASQASAEMNADGDINLPEGADLDFRIPNCDGCGVGVYKTDVVFFGDNVPREDVDLCYHELEKSSGLLVLGSSLQVMSGFRFAMHAKMLGIPLFIVNIGQTRADHLASFRLNCAASLVVSRL